MWTDHIFGSFNGGWNLSTKEHEGPCAEERHQLAPIPDLSSTGSLFRFTLLHCIVSNYFGPECSDEGYMMLFVETMLEIRENIKVDCEERESMENVLTASWKSFRHAFPSLPEDVDEEEGEKKGEEEEGEEEEEDAVGPSP